MLGKSAVILKNEHHNKMHNSQLFTCSYCSKRIKLRRNFVRHLALHCNLGECYQCSICQRKFNTKSNMRRHERDCIAKMNLPSPEQLPISMPKFLDQGLHETKNDAWIFGSCSDGILYIMRVERSVLDFVRIPEIGKVPRVFCSHHIPFPVVSVVPSYTVMGRIAICGKNKIRIVDVEQETGILEYVDSELLSTADVSFSWMAGDIWRNSFCVVVTNSIHIFDIDSGDTEDRRERIKLRAKFLLENGIISITLSSTDIFIMCEDKIYRSEICASTGGEIKVVNHFEVSGS